MSISKILHSLWQELWGTKVEWLSKVERLEYQLGFIHADCRKADEIKRREIRNELRLWEERGGPEKWRIWIQAETSKLPVNS